MERGDVQYVKFLIEAGRLRIKRGGVTDLARRDDLWLLDDPPSAAWFEEALAHEWTRDPFDRLLVAHARLRGWRFATADHVLIDAWPEKHCLAI